VAEPQSEQFNLSEIEEAIERVRTDPRSAFDYPEVALKRIDQITFALREASSQLTALQPDVTDSCLKRMMANTSMGLYGSLVLFTLLGAGLTTKPKP
jgi:hypothetical protein